jgi:hypothetical protein
LASCLIETQPRTLILQPQYAPPMATSVLPLLRQRRALVQGCQSLPQGQCRTTTAYSTAHYPHYPPAPWCCS